MIQVFSAGFSVLAVVRPSWGRARVLRAQSGSLPYGRLRRRGRWQQLSPNPAVRWLVGTHGVKLQRIAQLSWVTTPPLAHGPARRVSARPRFGSGRHRRRPGSDPNSLAGNALNDGSQFGPSLQVFTDGEARSTRKGSITFVPRTSGRSLDSGLIQANSYRVPVDIAPPSRWISSSMFTS